MFQENQTDEFIQINKFSYLHDGQHIIFCKTDYLKNCFDYIKNLKNEVILITGNSDYSITKDMFSFAPKNIKKWFAQNCEVENSIVEGLPLGLENSIACNLPGHGYVWDHALEKPKKIASTEEKSPTKKVYANFSLDTHPSRGKVSDLCKSLNFITCDFSNNHSTINKRSYDDYLNSIKDHDMVVCPRGNGVDCHRIWEVLYLGRTPIIKNEVAISWFKSLPIISLESWDQLCDLRLLQEKLDIAKKNSLEGATFSYWKTRILSWK